VISPTNQRFLGQKIVVIFEISGMISKVRRFSDILNISPSDNFFGIWQLFFIYFRLGNLTKDKFFTGL
jgi:hypothetical protein